ncbi:MAG TPA: hypothetical protein VIX80_07265 [Candidatus Kapabacteria bacterium]
MPIESIEVPRDEEETPVERVSSRYGIPQNEVEALIAGKPIDKSEPHPLTMGVLMDKQQTDVYMHDEKQSWSPIAVLGAILGVIGILSLIVLLVFIMRTPKKPEAVVARQEIATPAPVTEVNPVLPPIDTIASAAPPTSDKPKAAPKKKQVSSRSYLTTTNSLEAEEKLAELRAEGNRKAKINISSKNGVTTYKVQ